MSAFEELPLHWKEITFNGMKNAVRRKWSKCRFISSWWYNNMYMEEGSGISVTWVSLLSTCLFRFLSLVPYYHLLLRLSLSVCLGGSRSLFPPVSPRSGRGRRVSTLYVGGCNFALPPRTLPSPLQATSFQLLFSIQPTQLHIPKLSPRSSPM